jgi:hypothetical protein
VPMRLIGFAVVLAAVEARRAEPSNEGSYGRRRD